MKRTLVRFMMAMVAAAFLTVPNLSFAQANPCAGKNPCAANPCAANPCAPKAKKGATVKQGTSNPCAANPCAANPCAAKNPCAANPCAAKKK